jgi:hypothetical protein
MQRAAGFGWASLMWLALLLPGFSQGQPVEQQTSLSGWFHIIWEDPLPDSNQEPTTRYVLIGDQEEWIDLLLDKRGYNGA